MAETANPEVIALAKLVSFATLADPGLIRRMRLKFLPKAEAGIEGDLWFLPIVQQAGREGIVFYPNAADDLRRELAREDPVRYEAVWEETARIHESLSPTLRLEEEIGYLAHSGRDDREILIRDRFRSAVAALRDPSRAGLAYWAARALPRFPLEVRETEGARLLAAGAGFRLSNSLSVVSLFPKDNPAEWAWLAPGHLEPVSLTVRLFDEVLEIGPSGEPAGGEEIKIPKTDPLVLDVGSREQGRGSKVFISYQREEITLAGQVAAGLKKLGMEPLLDSYSIGPGDDMGETIREQIREAGILVAVVTPRWRAGFFSHLEVEAAIKQGANIVPLLFDGASESDLDIELRQWRAHEIRKESYQQDFAAAIDAVRTLAEGSDPLVFHPLQFRAGETRRVKVRGDRVRLRTAIGDEYELMTVKAALQDVLSMWDARQKAEALVELAPKLTDGLIEKAFGMVQDWDPGDRTRVYMALARHMAGERREGALRAALTSAALISGEEEKVEAVTQLARLLREQFLPEVISIIEGVQDQGLRERAVTDLLPYLPADLAREARSMIESRVRSGGAEGTKLWTLRAVSVLQAHVTRIKALAFTSDATHLFSASTELSLWDIRKGARAYHNSNARGIRCLAIASDGRLISGLEDGTLQVSDVGSGAPPMELKAHSAPVEAVAVCPDCSWVISGSQDETLTMWSLPDGREIRSLTGHTAPVTSVAVTPDGVLALSGSQDATVRVWDLTLGKELGAFTGHLAAVNCVAVTPDGRHGISGSDDATVRIWNLQTGEELNRLTDHHAAVSSLALAADGTWLISGSLDRQVIAWDLANAEAIASFTAGAAVASCAVSPEANLFAAGDDSGKLYLLRLESEGPSEQEQSDEEEERRRLEKERWKSMKAKK